MVFGLSSMTSAEPASVLEADAAATGGPSEQHIDEQHSSIAHAEQDDAAQPRASPSTAVSAGHVLPDQQQEEAGQLQAGNHGGAEAEDALSAPAEGAGPSGLSRAQSTAQGSPQEQAKGAAQTDAGAEEEEQHDKGKPHGDAALQEDASAEEEHHVGHELEADAAKAHDDAAAETEQPEEGTDQTTAPGEDGTSREAAAEQVQHQQAQPEDIADPKADDAAAQDVLDAAGEPEVQPWQRRMLRRRSSSTGRHRSREMQPE